MLSHVSGHVDQHFTLRHTGLPNLKWGGDFDTYSGISFESDHLMVSLVSVSLQKLLRTPTEQKWVCIELLWTST